MGCRRRQDLALADQRELEQQRLFDVTRVVERPEDVHVHLTRDAWTGPRTRVAVEQWSLLPRRPLTELTPSAWRRALVEARNSLAGPGGGRGTASLIRVKTQMRKDFEVCPHLNFGVELRSAGTPQERMLEMRRAMAQLGPLHEFLTAGCA